ncbi:hypothetical protein Tco_0438382 [Tanacetum coccineum]
MLPSNIIYLYVCPAVGSTCADIMADLNIPANDAPVEQAPAVAPPTRTDDQILPLSKWVPIGKSNCVLDVHKPQRNPIFPIENTNFIMAFNGIHNNSRLSTFSSIGTSIVFLTTSTLVVQLSVKAARIDRPETPCASYSFWVSLHRSYIDNAKDLGRVCHTKLILQHLKKQAQHTPRPGFGSSRYLHTGKLRTPSGYVRKDGREYFGIVDTDSLLNDAIKSAPYYSSYLEHVTEYQRYLNEEHDKADDKSPEPASSQSPKLTPTPT